VINLKELVKGISASRGTARGKIRLVLEAKDIGKVCEGDILVARHTEPSFTIAMMKAVAFVTDIGGTCSHAAIIARELGVPCIVAAIDATKILKEGQEVIVDADKGIVFSADE